MLSVPRSSKFMALAVFALASLTLLAGIAEARVGAGGSFGSRGTRTFSAPPATTTAPKAAPIEKSMTQPSRTAPADPASSRFGGWRGLLLGGVFAALFAAIFGVGALASVLGFLLQLVLIGGAAYLIVSYLRNRTAPALATAGPGARRRPGEHPIVGVSHSSRPLTISGEDYDAFERLLGEIQLAYGRQDLSSLAQRVTPEMLASLAAELDANAKKGIRNEISEPKLLQGDLAEAWREPEGDYATVAMRFSLRDVTVDAQSGRVVGGSRTQAQEATEIWTFRRPANGNAGQWELSAIQQAESRLPLAS